MTIAEAKRIRSTFHHSSCPSEDEVFLFTEAMEYLIRQTADPNLMMELGGYYYETMEFPLALKYYEMAAEYKLPDAYLCLGYVWYYGRTGTRDFAKAYEYFSLAASSGSLVAEYKLADMIRNGYHVEKDYEKYRQIIEDLYPKVSSTFRVYDPLPEIATRLARIRTEEGRTDEALALYETARECLALRIGNSAFFGDLNMMMWLIDDVYRLKAFDAQEMDLFELYHLLTGPCEVSFRYNRQKYTVKAEGEGKNLCIGFHGSFFRNREEFFAKARISDVPLTSLRDELYGFEVEGWRS